MKKTIFIIGLILLIITFITGCFKFNEAEFICDCGKIEIEKKEYIAMCVVPEEVTINSMNYLRIESHRL